MNVDRELWAMFPAIAPAWYDPSMTVEEMLVRMPEQSEKPEPARDAGAERET